MFDGKWYIHIIRVRYGLTSKYNLIPIIMYISYLYYSLIHDSALSVSFTRELTACISQRYVDLSKQKMPQLKQCSSSVLTLVEMFYDLSSLCEWNFYHLLVVSYLMIPCWIFLPSVWSTLSSCFTLSITVASLYLIRAAISRMKILHPAGRCCVPVWILLFIFMVLFSIHEL